MRSKNRTKTAQDSNRIPGCSTTTDGSVSVFLIMVLAFVFLFTAVLIDYARIAAASVQQERLARAAVRSVMSSYDLSLQQSYGLFAFGGDNGEQLLSGVLNDNLYESGRGDAFNLLPVKLDSSSLAWSRSIGSYDIFRRQIAEEMKYKAPVDFALELAGKFRPLAAAMGRLRVQRRSSVSFIPCMMHVKQRLTGCLNIGGRQRRVQEACSRSL